VVGLLLYVVDLTPEVSDLNLKVSDLRSGGIRLNLSPEYVCICANVHNVNVVIVVDFIVNAMNLNLLLYSCLS